MEVAVAVHGFGRAGLFTTLLAGGTNRSLAGAVAAALGPRLRFDDSSYEVVDDLEVIPEELRGLHPDNPVNRPRLGGVQLELPPRIRGRGLHWAGAPAGPCPHTAALVEGLAEVASARWETGTS